MREQWGGLKKDGRKRQIELGRVIGKLKRKKGLR